MVNLCSEKDFYILNKIRSGEWVPSLDTGQVYSTRKKGFLRFSVTKNGYPTSNGVVLSHVIWIAANGAVPYGMQIDHINGDRTDNRLCNLQLVSGSENRMLSLARLTYAQAEEIRRRSAEDKIPYRKLAEEYGVSHIAIMSIVNNRTYTKPVDTSHVSEDDRRKLLEYYKNGGKVDTARRVFKIQQAVVRQVLEEELAREAKERKNQENEL